jgi:hypothetical protein
MHKSFSLLQNHFEDLTKLGDSIDNALLIRAKNEDIGVSLEYLYLDWTFGKNSYEIKSQSLLKINEKHYDLIEILLSNKTEKKVFFDISDFFGKY